MATVTNDHKCSGLKQCTLISHLSRGRKSKSSPTGLKSGCQQAGSLERVWGESLPRLFSSWGPFAFLCSRTPSSKKANLLIPVHVYCGSWSSWPPPIGLCDSPGPTREECPGHSSLSGSLHHTYKVSFSREGNIFVGPGGEDADAFGDHCPLGKRPAAGMMEPRFCLHGGCSLPLLPRAEREQ